VHWRHVKIKIFKYDFFPISLPSITQEWVIICDPCDYVDFIGLFNQIIPTYTVILLLNFFFFSNHFKGLGDWIKMSMMKCTASTELWNCNKLFSVWFCCVWKCMFFYLCLYLKFITLDNMMSATRHHQFVQLAALRFRPAHRK